MSDVETGGLRGARFPSTCWTDLLAGSATSEARARQAFETLSRRYLRPVAAYVRSRFAKSDEDAFDRAQDFFLWMLESGFLARAERGRGSFRGFVKRTLANFLHDSERRARTWKRGGTRRFVPLEGDGAPLELPDGGATPEDVLDRSWRRTLLTQAADALEAELAAKQKQRTFDVFRDYFLGEEDLDYAAVAARHGITTTDVSNALAFAKKRYRAHLKNAVADTVDGDDDLRAELSWLFEEPPEKPRS